MRTDCWFYKFQKVIKWHSWTLSIGAKTRVTFHKNDINKKISFKKYGKSNFSKPTHNGSTIGRRLYSKLKFSGFTVKILEAFETITDAGRKKVIIFYCLVFKYFAFETLFSFFLRYSTGAILKNLSESTLVCYVDIRMHMCKS